MNKKISLIAVSVALALSGCGSDDSSTTVAKKQTGSFIDAKVEGLYYHASPSGLNGWTNANGEYQSNSGDTITFYLGGKDGLKIGASSERGENGVITPFESMGKYDRAVTLARILQTLDTDPADDNLIVIPEALTTNISNEAIQAVNLIQLDKFESASTLFDELAIDTADKVSEDAAIAHMEAAFGDMRRGSDTAIATFALDSGKVIRNVSVSQTVSNTPVDRGMTYVHADKTLTDDEFEKTRGMNVMLLEFKSTGLNQLPGTNDYTNESNIGSNTVFKYKLTDKTQELDTEVLMPWEDSDLSDGSDDSVPDFGPLACADSETGCTPSKLNTMLDDIRNDGTLDAPKYQREIESGSYDPVTGIHSVVRKKIACTANNINDCDGRTTTYLDYYYEVPNASEERYVDFTGTWDIVTTKPNCDIVARSTMTFKQDRVIITGDDFGNACELEDMSGEMNLSDLPGDYWWFNQTGRTTKATLTELNTVVRWCDVKDYVGGTPCADEYFNKWEYQPAGKNWDQGILTNRKMTSDGTTKATHYMQKTQ